MMILLENLEWLLVLHISNEQGFIPPLSVSSPLLLDRLIASLETSSDSREDPPWTMTEHVFFAHRLDDDEMSHRSSQLAKAIQS